MIESFNCQFAFPCAFHHEELITGFCKSPECLLPLCPKCIRDHSFEHQDAQTQMNFEAISQLINQTRVQLSARSRMLVTLGETLKDISMQGQQKKQQFIQKLRQGKKLLFNEMERFFDRLQHSIVSDLQHHQQQTSLSLQNIDYNLVGVLSKIKKSQEQLQTENCLRTLIQFHSEPAEKFQNFYHKLQLDLNGLSGRDLVLQIKTQPIQGAKKQLEKMAKLVRQGTAS